MNLYRLVFKMTLPIEYIQDSTTYNSLYVMLIRSPVTRHERVYKLRNNYFLGIL